MELPILSLTFLALLLPQSAWMIDDYTEMCRLFKKGTQIRKPGTCNEYIKCNDDSGENLICRSPTGQFEPSRQACVASATAATVNYCGNRCANKDQVWVSDPTNCQNYFYCHKGEALKGGCEVGMHFDEAKQQCVYDVNSQCIDVGNICEVVADRTTFRNEKDCSSYYECRSGKHSLKKCSSSTYYDVESGKCISKALVSCNAHPYSGVCTNGLKIFTGFKTDSATCRGYFYCRDFDIVPDVEPIWGQCPEGLFFDGTSQSCKEPKSVVCKLNRCEGRGNMLVTASSNDCHNYIICKNGMPVEERTCMKDMFFDESIQACTTTMIFDECCDKQK